MKNQKKHYGDTEKYVAPKKEKKEYTLTDIKGAFKRGIIVMVVLDIVVFSAFKYFTYHTINETINSLKSVSDNITSMINNKEV